MHAFATKDAMKSSFPYCFDIKAGLRPLTTSSNGTGIGIKEYTRDATPYSFKDNRTKMKINRVEATV
ncbi:unnamed protein product [Leptidea sinapis]|uniref:Uncharacterized protein n=1 Tax=Leptidea sinapis TaxID=189913 RepID=A0A5E4PQU6_9NEOP|nr:unnamed protein product [Leptidea sinapis]